MSITRFFGPFFYQLTFRESEIIDKFVLFMKMDLLLHLVIVVAWVFS